MMEVAIAETVQVNIPATATLDQWIETGRQLSTMKRRLGFMIGDWVNHGREHFPAQIEMALETAGIDQKFAQKAANVSRLFPSHCRADGLSFDHHRALVKLPAPERIELLQKAHQQHWEVGELRSAVTQWRYDHGELFDDEDVDSHLCTLIVQAWNRASKQAREDFMARATLAKFGIIDEDEVTHE